ncbi:S-adenosylmethionine-dependent methyltransferase domain-containing protein isoform 1-T1 [Menidia menidia]
MEQSSCVCPAVGLELPGRQKEGKDMKQDGETQAVEGTSDEALTDEQVMAGEAQDRRNIWEPSFYYSLGKESFHFAGHDISIRESMDTFGALIWPGVCHASCATAAHSVVHADATLRIPSVLKAIALCEFLENNQQQMNLMDKAVIEIGAGTGLLSIVASLLGAWVTATDLPDVLSNLTFNLRQNTRGRSRYAPQVAALSWGQDLDRDFPCPSFRYSYVLAADVVYHHQFLDELLDTMRHFCRPGSGTTILWANKVRFQSDLRFTEGFRSSFNTVLLTELPQQGVRIYKATAKE